MKPKKYEVFRSRIVLRFALSITSKRHRSTAVFNNFLFPKKNRSYCGVFSFQMADNESVYWRFSNKIKLKKIILFNDIGQRT